MKDEIKEILARLKNNDFERDCNDGSCYKELYLSEIQTLLDYITNLQEENKRLKKELDYADNYNIYLISRIDKAIEKLYSGYNVVDYDDTDFPRLIVDDAMNILQGEDKE